MEQRIIKKLKGNNLGTLDLAKRIGIPPKTLLKYLKDFSMENLIERNIYPAKPRGRKVVWRLKE